MVEIAFDGVQRSPRYPGGVALRFARVLRYREDKTAAEADTIDAIRALSRLAKPSPARLAEPPASVSHRAANFHDHVLLGVAGDTRQHVIMKAPFRGGS